MFKDLAIYKITAYLFLTINIIQPAFSQEKGQILSKYYSPVDYNYGNQNWAIAQDNRGVLYFGNAAGILEFDGVTWRTIANSNNSNIRSLAFDSNNVLYAGGYNEFGFLKPDKTGNLVYSSLVHLLDSNYIDFGETWNVHCFSDTVFFLTEKFLFRYVNGEFNYWKSNRKRFYYSYEINGSYYIQEIGRGLLKFEDNQLKPIIKAGFFSNIRIHSILPYGDDLLICTRTKGLYLYSTSNNKPSIKSFSDISPETKILNDFFIKNVFYVGISITDSTYALSSISGDILMIDKKWNITDIINNESIGIKSSIHYLYYDKNNSLWVALANGISQIDILSPFRFWNDDKGVNGTFSDIARLNEYLYISTGSGVYYTNSKETSRFELNSFNSVEGAFEQTWGFLYYQPKGSELFDERINNRETKNRITTKNTILLVSSSKGLFQIIEKKSKLIAEYKSIYLAYQYKEDPNFLFLGLENGLAMLSFQNGKWKDHGKIAGTSGMIRYISEDSIGTLWLSASYKGLFKIENPTNINNQQDQIEFLDTTNNLPSIKSIGIVYYQDTLFFYSGRNYFTYKPKTKQFELYVIPEVESQPTESADSIKNEPVDTLSHYRMDNKLLTLGYVVNDDEKDLWYGTTKGICRFRYNNLRNYNDINPTFIRQVYSGDSIIYNGTNYTNSKINTSDYYISKNPAVDLKTILKYKNNSLTFFYASPFFEENTKNKYSYYLEGFDKKWSDWTTETKKEYTNLREKEYSFKVKSKNIYNVETPIGEYKFKVLPPWYRNLSAYIAYIILGILLIILIVKLYTLRLIRDKDKLEEIVIERTQEILMQKEEILVQAEHLKDANQGITAKNEELEKQKWEITNQAIKLKKANVELIKLSKVASETDNAIGIFDKEGNIVWVNDGFTRMYGYTFDQYKKERNSNIFKSSDNPNINEAIKSCITDKKSVVYKFKTKTRAGKEIWTQTTLTHVIDKDEETINLIAIDSDITDLIHAENEIAEQRDKLALSNATKNKFFRIIAHDLRNPISTLAASTGLIFKDFEDYNNEEMKSFIGELNKLSQTTYNLLENLLDWSSTQMGDISFNPEPIDLHLITRENIELINRKISQKNINLKLNIPNKSIAFADENMVKTIVRNLLSNAVKFTPEKGEIEISTIVKKDFVHFIVKDTGIGIEKENLKKLFKIEQHYTALGLDNEKGSGLGLILCKGFVEKNGGKITIESNKGKGTTIEFTLKNHLS